MHHLKVRNPNLRLGRLVAIYLLVLAVAAGLTGEIVLHRVNTKHRSSSFAGASNGSALPKASAVGSNSSTCNSASLSPVLPQTGKIFVGVTTAHSGWSMNGISEFAKQIGVQPSMAMFYSGWGGQPAFNSTPFNNIHKVGMMPMLDWEPWNYLAPSAVSVGQFNQSQFSETSLMSGTYRQFIKSWALGIKSLGYPVALDFAHEMNGNWYPWAASVNGNSPANFVALWRYVHDIFTEVGANNVIWVWSPNVNYPGSTPLDSLWPGSNYVNWAGVVGYFWGSSNPSPPSFSSIFGATLTQIQSITSKPILITETSGSNSSGQKVQWISSFFRGLVAHPQIIGFNWFNIKKRHNWTVDSTPGSLAAFREGLSTIPLVSGTAGGTTSVSTSLASSNTNIVTGQNASQTCKPSNQILKPAKRPVLTPPNPPKSVEVRADNSAALVSWSAPSHSGTAPLTGYVVTPYIGSVPQIPVIFKSPLTVELITGLTSGVTYTFRVAATSKVGVSAMSAPSSPFGTGSSPNPPTSIAAKSQSLSAFVP